MYDWSLMVFEQTCSLQKGTGPAHPVLHFAAVRLLWILRYRHDVARNVHRCNDESVDLFDRQCFTLAAKCL